MHTTTCDFLVKHAACTCRQSNPAEPPRIVTPEQAQNALRITHGQSEYERNLLLTIVAEPDRTRAAVVKALREYGGWGGRAAADAIENGADW
jgi:hypothetical protein